MVVDVGGVVSVTSSARVARSSREPRARWAKSVNERVTVSVPQRAPEGPDAEAKCILFGPDGAEMLFAFGLIDPDGPGHEFRTRLKSWGVPAGFSVVGGSVRPGKFRGASKQQSKRATERDRNASRT